VDAERKPPSDDSRGAFVERRALQHVQLDLRAVAAEVQQLSERVEVMSAAARRLLDDARKLRTASAHHLEGVALHLERLANIVSARHPVDKDDVDE